ncbi:carbohydrate esterase family 4 protein [Gonapodya prolifera JEL478]|uniref:Carbohydrate esterase family 4 protein n=1 Tax=Gonapodya prolifera (strain JEL478) TaxID=1344416 RepID=A0A139ASI5_GONPJ|nr:carbohydrate esterase family 4 protein [Gonapodya prolifera JEL478]|eukprot:KXS19707.1 carbohydrate esterase family 4 protein [Gonapodya prolifera JEL478]
MRLGLAALLIAAARGVAAQSPPASFANTNWPVGPNGLVNETIVPVPLTVTTNTTFTWRGRTFTVPDQPITTTKDGCGDNRWISGCGEPEYVWNCNQPKSIGFVFDDGPNYWTRDIMQAFKDAGDMKATFCMVGRMLVLHPAGVSILKEVIAAGHDICIHTMNHLHLSSLSNEEIAEEIMGDMQIFRDILGPTFIPRFLRPPFGDLDLRVKAIADTLGLKILLWNLDTKDYVTSAAGITNLTTYFTPYQAYIAPANTVGYITLAHDIINQTHQVLPQVLQLVQSSGYNTVLPSNCTGMGRWLLPQDLNNWIDADVPNNIPNAQVTPYPMVYADPSYTGITRGLSGQSAATPTGGSGSGGQAKATATSTATPTAGSSSSAPSSSTGASKPASASRASWSGVLVAGLAGVAAVVAGGM